MRKVWTARVGSAGNWRIVGEPDEVGPGKRREPSIATKEMLNVGSWRAVVNRFFPRKELTEGLADIFYVTGDSVIGRLACVVQGTVIMKRSVAVTGVRLAHN